MHPSKSYKIVQLVRNRTGSEAKKTCSLKAIFLFQPFSKGMEKKRYETHSRGVEGACDIRGIVLGD